MQGTSIDYRCTKIIKHLGISGQLCFCCHFFYFRAVPTSGFGPFWRRWVLRPRGPWDPLPSGPDDFHDMVHSNPKGSIDVNWCKFFKFQMHSNGWSFTPFLRPQRKPFCRLAGRKPQHLLPHWGNRLAMDINRSGDIDHREKTFTPGSFKIIMTGMSAQKCNWGWIGQSSNMGK